MSWRHWMALVSLLGLFLGAYLTLYKFGYIGTIACGISSCEQVQTSKWSVFLGLPVATWGAGFYAMMLTLSIIGMQPRFADSHQVSRVYLVLSGWGMLFTAWLNYLEAFTIHAWCEWCIGSASMVLILFALSWADWRSTRPSLIESDA